MEQDLVLSVDNETANKSATASQENRVTVFGTYVTRQDLQQTQETASSGDVVPLQTRTSPPSSSSDGRQDSVRKNSLVHHQDSVTPDGRVLITIPYGSKPGDKIRVRHEDGRIIETTIPKELPADVTNFYVKVPTANHQNWHDNPVVAGAPLLAGPFFGI